MTITNVEQVSDSLASKQALEASVNEQYDTDASMLFYKYIMGGGGDDIHYGVFHTGEEDLKESSENTVALLAEHAWHSTRLRRRTSKDPHVEHEPPVRVLDLGSGKGGAARYLARTFGCHVTCVNLGARQNAYNEARAKEEGVADLIVTHLASFNEPLPAEWSNTFDLVWSQEALCHAADQGAVVKEVSRVLKPGGTFVFSDIMKGDGAASEDAESFTGQNASLEIASPQLYRDAVAGASLRLLSYVDLTPHLGPYFALMLQCVQREEGAMLAGGVDPARVAAYHRDLKERQGRVRAGHFAWGAYVAKKAAPARVLVVGAGPVGSFLATRLASAGTADVTVKVRENTAAHVLQLLAAAGCVVAEEWEAVRGQAFDASYIAVKAHWLPRVAHDITCHGVRCGHVALLFNGYALRLPAALAGAVTCVVSQSFIYEEPSSAAGKAVGWSVTRRNISNPWVLPDVPTSHVIVAQLKHCGVTAEVRASYDHDRFFKFCVNASANLLSVLQGCVSCAALVQDRDAAAIMVRLLHELFNTLALDEYYAPLVPIDRDEYCTRVLTGAPGSVASYGDHLPSSCAAFRAGKIVDTASLNGFVVLKAREAGVAAPWNEYVARAAAAASKAAVRGVSLDAWLTAVDVAALQRSAESLGLGVSVWGHATARDPRDASRMLLAPFGTTFGEAHAYALQSVPQHPDLFAKPGGEGPALEDFNETAVVIHGAVYGARPDVGCIVHTHPPYATALAASAAPFAAHLSQDAMQFVGRVARHAFAGVADDKEEMESLAAVLRGQEGGEQPDVVFLDNHGVLVVGADAASAFSRLYYLERACQVQLMAHGSGTLAAFSAAEKESCVCPAGVQHTREWYAKSGRKAAAAEWRAQKRALILGAAQAPEPAFFE